jgi:hypothetical protein
LPAVVFDGCMLRVYATKRTPRRFLIYKHNLLSVTNGGEEATDWVTWNLAGKEEPIDGPVEGELRGRACEDEQNQIRVAPDPAHD